MAQYGENIRFAFQPRPYQVPSFKAKANGYKRGVCIWPRRHGKDLHGLVLMVGEALKRVGLYNYYFPTFSLAKKIVWKGMDKDGRPFLSYIPAELIKDKNETDLRIELTNGSILQLVGTDNINQNMVGINPIGCLFTEYPLQNPMAWELTRPILAENGGWAWFLYTPRGRNHGYRLYQIAKDNPESWFLSHETIETTTLDGTKPVITPEYVREEIEQGMDPDLAKQEYWCSFDSPMQGSYYGRLMAAAFQEGRIGFYPPVKNIPVVSGWDIGVGEKDETAIWYAQLIGEEIRLIDYFEGTGEDFAYYFKHTMESPWVNSEVFVPFDIEKTHWGTGKSSSEIVVRAFSKVGVKVRTLPKLRVSEGIGVVRALFHRLKIHDDQCGKKKYRGHSGTDAITSYHRKYNEDRQEYEDTPHHNWASHAADALRYLLLGVRDLPASETSGYYNTRFDPMQDHDERGGYYESEFTTEPDAEAVEVY